MDIYKSLGDHFKKASEAKSPYYFVVHEHACPDSLGASMGLVRLAKMSGLEAKIVGDFKASTGYPSNADVLKYSGVELVNPSDVEQKSQIMYVDCHPGSTNLLKVKGDIVAVLDHHKLKEDGSEDAVSNLAFSDVRIDYNSASSIVADHLSVVLGKTGFDPENGEDKKLATVLMHGIRTDTKKLIKGNKNDYLALALLEGIADKSKIAVWEDYRYPDEILALLNRGESVSVGPYLAYVIPEVGNSDFVSPTADLLTEFEGHDVNIVVAEVLAKGKQKRRFVVRGRSRRASHDIGDILNSIFGAGGGKEGAGGADIPYNQMFTHFKLKIGKDVSVTSQILFGIESGFNKLVEVRDKDT